MSSTWLTDKISDLPIEIIDGDRSKRYPKRSEFQDSGIPFLNSTNIDNDHLDLSQVNFISPEKYAQIKKGRLQPMDIIMTTRGSIGKVALFNNPRYIRGLINAQMLIIRADGEVIDQEFLFFYLCSDIFQKLVANFASGAAQPQIPIRDLQDIPIVYPPLPTQRKIAAILSAYDDLIENNARRIAILERMAQLLYREWFVRFRFPGHEDVEMVDSELGPIPAGWEVKRLGDVAKQVRRNVQPDEVDPATPYIGLGHMPKNGIIALPDWGTADETKSTKLRFRVNEILFGKIRPYFHKVGVAPINGVSSTDAIIIVPKEQTYFSIVLGCVSSKEFVDYG